MAQGQDLAVHRLHGVENLLELDLHLGWPHRAGGRGEQAGAFPPARPSAPAASPGGGRSPITRRPASGPSGDGGGGPGAPGRSGAGARGMGVCSAVPGIPAPAGDLEVGVLEDVGGVDAGPLQPAVEAKPDHPPEPLAGAAQSSVSALASPPSRRRRSSSRSSSSRTCASPISFIWEPEPFVHRLSSFSDITIG